MVKGRLKNHEKAISEIVNDVLNQMFSSYFRQSIKMESFAASILAGNTITASTMLYEKDHRGVILVSIERDVLEILSKAVFEQESDLSASALESCLTEIANIVCSRIKTYFNEYGYDMMMEIPVIVSEKNQFSDSIKILFSIQNGKLMIDISIEDLPEITDKKVAVA